MPETKLPMMCRICDGEQKRSTDGLGWVAHTVADCLLELRKRIDKLEIERDLRKAFEPPRV